MKALLCLDSAPLREGTLCWLRPISQQLMQRGGTEMLCLGQGEYGGSYTLQVTYRHTG